ncbi:UvrD-helicase domain-containing protein [Sphaerisporangium sp. TRM90804]|uniref:UvrD-helicase domain-containing protein n=1 Tax=Sphaerisporangium sp. TRM90804 TaxID=3031113 RepID=UPI00244D49CD|nr:UvrD-helicase domain-containing protein [Sphaerisporangium sp. TRM90804]MDH2430319.1 UvrD-helicase domain-containing protein [Sphaerisporangium sp. TRM90804]
MTNLVQLTEEQERLVEEPATARLLVTAAAGTGKTLSLIRRLVHLIEEEGLDPADLLVLSFSRAAVREVRNRLLEHGTAAAQVEVRTFDSYATWVLSEVAPDGPWRRQSFDGRIREATRAIKENPDAQELLGETRHLVVDEVQDLVGDRAELVKALLETDLEGFTLLGDPAQGIYGFQLDDPRERLAGAARLYEWVRDRFRDDLVEASLSDNFRAREPEAMVALSFGTALGAVDAAFGDIQRDLRTTLLAGDSLGTLDQAVPVLSRLAVPTALLCRANDEALLISRRLHALGVRHRLQRAAQDRVIPVWVAALFRELDSKQPTKAAVMDVLYRAGADAEEAWNLLRRMDRNRRGEVLDLTAVRRRLVRADLPDELTQPSPELLVVSTIHRVKGLEFDQVVVVDPGDAPDDDPIERAERARLMYVAMTRPRDLLIHVKSVDRLSSGHLRKQSDGRWAELGFQAGRRFGVEVRAEDVNREEPAGTAGFREDPEKVQRYLASKVRSGDAVTLTRLPQSSSAEPLMYVVRHEGNGIGVTTDSFAGALRTLLPGRDRRFPPGIGDLRVDCVETVVGREAAGVNAGLGWSGVWLRPRVMGLGRFTWDGELA